MDPEIERKLNRIEQKFSQLKRQRVDLLTELGKTLDTKAYKTKLQQIEDETRHLEWEKERLQKPK